MLHGERITVLTISRSNKIPAWHELRTFDRAWQKGAVAVCLWKQMALQRKLIPGRIRSIFMVSNQQEKIRDSFMAPASDSKCSTLLYGPKLLLNSLILYIINMQTCKEIMTKQVPSPVFFLLVGNVLERYCKNPDVATRPSWTNVGANVWIYQKTNSPTPSLSPLAGAVITKASMLHPVGKGDLNPHTPAISLLHCNGSPWISASNFTCISSRRERRWGGCCWRGCHYIVMCHRRWIHSLLQLPYPVPPTPYPVSLLHAPAPPFPSLPASQASLPALAGNWRADNTCRKASSFLLATQQQCAAEKCFTALLQQSLQWNMHSSGSKAQ